MNTTSLNSRERKAQRLLAHYATCERLARYLKASFSIQIRDPERKPLREIDGKRISVALLKLEKQLSMASVSYCNGDSSRETWDRTVDLGKHILTGILGTLPPGFFVNSDPRGYALKINNENAEGRALIEAVGLQRDMGGYGILSPEINGDR